MRSSIGIVLFFLLSGLFLSILLGALERSGRLLAVAGACLVAVVCVIVFLTPVRLPDLDTILGVFQNDDDTTTTTSTEVPGVEP